MCVFSCFSRTMEIHLSYVLGTAWISASHKKFKKPLTLKLSCIFPYFSLTMGIQFSYILGIIWISASPRIFKKLINLKCLCFPILSLYYRYPLFLCFKSSCVAIFLPYYGNSLFPYFGNCMD